MMLMHFAQPECAPARLLVRCSPLRSSPLPIPQVAVVVVAVVAVVMVVVAVAMAVVAAATVVAVVAMAAVAVVVVAMVVTAVVAVAMAVVTTKQPPPPCQGRHQVARQCFGTTHTTIYWWYDSLNTHNLASRMACTVVWIVPP